MIARAPFIDASGIPDTKHKMSFKSTIDRRISNNNINSTLQLYTCHSNERLSTVIFTTHKRVYENQAGRCSNQARRILLPENLEALASERNIHHNNSRCAFPPSRVVDAFQATVYLYHKKRFGSSIH